MNVRMAAVLALAAGCLFFPASGNATSPPDIPGKIYVKTLDGCGQLYDAASATPDVLAFRANSYWIGDCRHGLYHGFGYWLDPTMKFSPTQSAYMLFGEMQFTRASITPSAGVSEIGLGGSVVVSLFNEARTGFDQALVPMTWKTDQALAPFYPTPDGSDLDEFSFTYTALPDSSKGAQSGFNIGMDSRSCIIAEKKIRGCKPLYADFPIYGVKLTTHTEAGSSDSFTQCPDPKTTAGCDALWREIAGPYIEKIVRFVETTEQVMVAEHQALANASAAAEAALPAGWKQYWAENPMDRSAVSMAMQCREISDFYPSSLTNAFYVKQKYSTAPCNSAITAAYAIAQADTFISIDSKGKDQEAAIRESYAQAKARRDAANAAAWNGFFNTANVILDTAIQIQQQKADAAYAQAAALAQQQQSQPAYESYSSSAGSSAAQQTYAADKVKITPIHRPELDAKHCVKLIEVASGDSALSGGGRVFSNQCGQTVEIFWCTVEECERGSGNMWTLGVGGSWPAPRTDVRYGACLGRNSGRMVDGSKGNSYACTGS